MLVTQEEHFHSSKDGHLHDTETNWEELLWNYPKATAPYTACDWQKIVDGLVDSFNRFLGVHFVHAETPRLFIENDLPTISLNLTCMSPTPFGALKQLAKGSIVVYETEKEKHLDVNFFVFLFLDKTRLKTESPSTAGQDGDYIEYVFAKNPGDFSTWECRGWNAGYYDEWKGTTFPERTAATHRIQLILPDKDDERYDPVTEILVLQACPCCGQDYAFPWRNSANHGLIWICRECEAAWKKHEVFSRDNVIGFEWSELEEVPHQNIVDDVPRYGTFPPEASHICLFSSNRFNVYECQMPQDCFEKLAHASHWKMEPTNEPVCIPRYHFRSFLEEQRRILSVEELRRRLPDSPFIHRTEQGFEYRQKKGKRNIHVVYDLKNATLYYYFFVDSTDNKIGQKALRLHETLMELCRNDNIK